MVAGCPSSVRQIENYIFTLNGVRGGLPYPFRVWYFVSHLYFGPTIKLQLERELLSFSSRRTRKRYSLTIMSTKDTWKARACFDIHPTFWHDMQFLLRNVRLYSANFQMNGSSKFLLRSVNSFQLRPVISNDGTLDMIPISRIQQICNSQEDWSNSIVSCATFCSPCPMTSWRGNAFVNMQHFSLYLIFISNYHLLEGNYHLPRRLHILN